MSVIVGDLHKKKTVRNMSGEIIDMLDETNGGWIIRNKQVVNQKRYDEILKIEYDKSVAAKAIAEQVSFPDAPDRTISPSKVDVLEKKVAGMEGKLDKILSALNK